MVIEQGCMYQKGSPCGYYLDRGVQLWLVPFPAFGMQEHVHDDSVVSMQGVRNWPKGHVRGKINIRPFCLGWQNRML